ncbi:ECF transporter S component [Georgenia subflava]|uniref:ECF transporter S component n=1 Tax=Georgenia subflava TaxID=1622177 RepID=UPI00186AF907|nr:ECF transporter S component [Georgenia subflava]
MGLVDSIKRDFTLMAILLIPVAVAINFVGGQLAKTLQLWIFLDSIGTFIVAMLAGPWIGLVTGALSVLLLALGDATMAPWSILAAAMGFLVGVLARRGMFNTWGRAAISALIVTLISVAVSVLLSYFLYGGFTTSGVSILTGAINDYSDLPLFLAVVASHVPAELIDKFLAVGIATLVVRSMSKRALLRFPHGEIFVDARKKDRPAARTAS